MIKVLLDTDIGNDIDDAICLAYLLAQEECDLLGITTVTGEPEKRAMMASALCKAAGRSIPVHGGCGDPILVEQRQKHPPQAERLANWAHDTDFPRGKAIPFLQETIRANPGEVVLLTIGPLTNAGVLFAMDPEIPSLLRGLVMMVGVFQPRNQASNPVEWNAGGDPHATAIMYRHAAQVHRSIGLDVTTRVTMRKEEVLERFKHPVLEPVLDFADVWFRQRDVITFHDPLAATTIFLDGICSFERGEVKVTLDQANALGRTTWQAGGDGPHEVALDVDPPAFFEHFFAVLS